MGTSTSNEPTVMAKTTVSSSLPENRTVPVAATLGEPDVMVTEPVGVTPVTSSTGSTVVMTVAVWSSIEPPSTAVSVTVKRVASARPVIVTTRPPAEADSEEAVLTQADMWLGRRVGRERGGRYVSISGGDV